MRSIRACRKQGDKERVEGGGLKIEDGKIEDRQTTIAIIHLLSSIIDPISFSV
jgi:hypothetical protein